MNLHQQIESDLKIALKSGDREKTGVLRLMISAIKNLQIEKKTREEKYMIDEEVAQVLLRQAKQRRDSIAEYEKGNREDLAEKEKKELEIIGEYLPKQLGTDEVRKIVGTKIKELGISDRSGFGKLMGAVMKELQGKAEGDLVKRVVEEELG